MKQKLQNILKRLFAKPAKECEQFPTKDDYQFAIYSQTACNLSGVVFGFARVMKRICYQARAEGCGTEWRNTHPICRLYAEQIYHLTRNADWQKAYDECERMAGIKK
jgi:hypothetical protein